MGTRKKEDISDQERFDIQMDNLEKKLIEIREVSQADSIKLVIDIHMLVVKAARIITDIRKNFKVEQNDGSN